MSWSDEELDKLFQEGTEQQIFEFKEEYWHEFEGMLPVNKKKGRFGWWFLSVPLMVLLGWGGIVLLTNESDTVDLNKTQGIDSINAKDQSLNESKTRIAGAVKQKELESVTVKSKAESNLYNERASFMNSPKESNLTIEPTKSTDFVSTDFVEAKSDITANSKLTQGTKANENLEIQNEHTIGRLDYLSLGQQDFSKDREQMAWNTPHSKRSSYFIELTGGIGQSWIYDEEGQNISASYGLTGGLTLPLNYFTFSAGLGLTGSRFDNLLIRQRTQVFGFGMNVIENSYRFTDVWALNSTFRVGYLMGRHHLEMAIDPSLKFLSVVQSSKFIDGAQVAYSKGYTNVQFFNQFGAFTSLKYAYFVNENLQIGAGLGVQLLEQVKSDRILGTRTSLPFEGSFFIRRTF